MRRAKKDSLQCCLRCLLKGDLCHSGTLKGNCIACGDTALTDPVNPFEGFFNEDLGTHLLSLARAPEYVLLSSDEDILEIDITTANGLLHSHRLLMQREFLPSNPHLKYQLDQMVWLYYIPKIRCKTATTSLITSALFGRGYLSILFPCNVVNGAEIFSNSFRLLSLVLTRLDESISEVVSAFQKDKALGDERYWSEISASLAILYPGLFHAQEGLKDRTIQPLCGGAKLAGLLAQRVESTLAHLTLLLHHQNLRCDPGWASILNGSLDEMRSNVTISSLSLRSMEQTGPMSGRALSTASFGSISISATSTPLSSIDIPYLENPGRSKFDTSAGIGWVDTGSIPSAIPPTKSSTSPSVHSRTSDIFNFFPPSPTNSQKQNIFFSPPSTLPYGNTFTRLGSSPVPRVYTSPGNGYIELQPESLPSAQVILSCYSGPNEIEQSPSHVSGPLSYDTRVETSVLASRDLFSDMQQVLHSSDEAESLAEQFRLR